MKRIWIDGYEANVPQRLGSGQVSFEVLRNIENLDHENDYTIFLPTSPVADMPKEREGWRYKVLKPKRLWTRIALPFALFSAKHKPDVFFTPTHYIPRFTKVKRVVMIFDLSYLHFKEMFKRKDIYQLNNWTRYSLENSTHILTISNTTKKDILKNYQIPNNKVTVVYPGFDANYYHPISDQSKIKEVKNKYNIDREYVIFVGTLQPRKNLIRLIESFAKIENLKLVIVGKTTGVGRQGWMFEKILKRPKELGITDKVIFTGFVPTEELPYLVNGAKAFVLPSLWEGFGIPAVDAMACGVPVVVSNVSSLPEVVGDAGLLFDPTSVDQIEQAIRTITTDKKLHSKLSKKAIERAKKFSWKKMTKDVIRVLETV